MEASRDESGAFQSTMRGDYRGTARVAGTEHDIHSTPSRPATRVFIPIISVQGDGNAHFHLRWFKSVSILKPTGNGMPYP
jgi:hypothetical protein